MEVSEAQVMKPDVNCEMATELVEKLYGFKVLSTKKLNSYNDQNFQIQVSPTYDNSYINSISPDGYTLKVMNTEKTAMPGHFESIHSVLEFLNQKGVTVPTPVPSRNGIKWIPEQIPLLQKHGSAKDSMIYGLCGIHLLTYIPGATISTITYTEDILKQWGEALAILHVSLEDFANDIFDKKDCFWSPPHLLEIKKFMQGLKQNEIEMIMDVLDNYQNLQSVIADMPKGYIHGDLNEANILVRETTDGYLVDGILDFEDMHRGLYVWDVGVMLAYLSLDCRNVDPIDGMGYALKGYFRRKKLSEKEMSLLKICIASRLCQSLVLGAYNYKLDPSNHYLLKTWHSGWQRLNLIWNTPDEIILKRWSDIRKH